MKVKVLKKEKRFAVRNDTSLGIQHYGEGNDYPQQLMQVVNASGTGGSCVDVYSKFISGKGFADKEFYRKTVNFKGQTNDYILDQISKDYAMFGGFALHVNYNANYQITEIQYIPLEHVRFEKMDENGHFGKVAIHWDWGRQFGQLRKWRKEDIELIHFYNPSPEIIDWQVKEAGGWNLYNGQVFYYSNAGEKTYPLPIYDSVITDMNTEEGISNVNNRNARNNFLSAGMFIDKKNTDESKEQENDTEKAVKEFQGDENACKMMYVQIESDEEKPEFVSFKGQNYDKEFEVTRKTVQDNIGKRFNQPPLLRAENVGANFGADLMKNAYNYYNSVTENERLVIERVFTQIFKNWFEATSGDYAILPLSYDVEMNLAEQLGEKGFEQLINILENQSLQFDQKRRMIKRLFNLSDEEINDLL